MVDTETLEWSFVLNPPGISLNCAVKTPLGRIVGIYGASGSGKTTLLRCLSGLVHPQGFLRIGREIWQDSRIFLPAHQRSVGYVFQEGRLFPHLTVQKNLGFGQRRMRRENVAFVENIIELTGVSQWLNRYPAQLSGGQQQRVALARALLVRPRLLLMDEPLTGLDPEAKAQLLDIIEAVQQQLHLSVFYVSHVLDELVRLADALLIMQAGAIVSMGKMAQVLAQPDWPLLPGDEAGVVLETIVEQHDSRYRMTAVRVGDSQLWLGQVAKPLGAMLRVRVLARDVSLALMPPQYLSLQNILAVTIVELLAQPQGVLVRLQLDSDTLLLGRISDRAVDRLQLRPGMLVYALIKAVAVLR